MVIAATKPPKAPDFISPAIHGFIHGALAVWPLWVLIALAALGKLGVEVYRLRRLSRSGIAEIDTMDGRTFEVFLSTLFQRLGYSVEITRYRGDYGADLVVKKNGRKIAVQAKRWRKQVGLKAVQEAVASKAIYGCADALVVANRDFTQQARQLARANKVELWDRETLVSKLLATNATASVSVADPPKLDIATAPLPRGELIDTEHCTTCGAAVSAKVRDYCLTRPSRFGGRVYCFKHQRSSGPALPNY